MLTVLFSTFNGARTLPVMMNAMMTLKAPVGGWKIVAVNNASTDNSRAILESYAKTLPITILHEKRKGKNRALNAGLGAVEGDLVVFTDDDVIPEPDWLIKMREAADHNSEFDIIGGVIKAAWPFEPPEWFFRIVPLGLTYGVTPGDIFEGPISPGMIWGANMAVRKKIFDAGYRYDENVGPQPGQYRMGSETEFVNRLGDNGHFAWHCADSTVGHIIRPEQMSPEWIIKRAYRFGRSSIANNPNGRHGNEKSVLWGLSRWKIRRLAQEYLKLIRAGITDNRDDAFQARWQIQFMLGNISEERNMRHQSSKSRTED